MECMTRCHVGPGLTARTFLFVFDRVCAHNWTRGQLTMIRLGRNRGYHAHRVISILTFRNQNLFKTSSKCDVLSKWFQNSNSSLATEYKVCRYLPNPMCRGEFSSSQNSLGDPHHVQYSLSIQLNFNFCRDFPIAQRYSMSTKGSGVVIYSILYR